MADARKKDGCVNAIVEPVPEPIKLDIGCGKNKQKGFIGIDEIKFEGVDVELNAGTAVWPWADNSVTEIHTSHFVEHLDAMERIHFVNEAYRVLQKVDIRPGEPLPSYGKLVVIVPHWASARAYGDMTHKWPPVSEFWFYYLDKGWRAANAPHNDIEFNPRGYKCDFMATWGYGMHAALQSRNPEYQQHAMQFWKEAIQDTHCTMTARK
jgi:hypothetical protein